MGFGVRRRSQRAGVGGRTEPSQAARESRHALLLLVPFLVLWTLAGGGGGCGPLPGNSELVGFIPSPGTARDVVTDPGAGLAYVASDEFGLTVVDVSDPLDPIALGAVNPPFTGYSLAASGSLVAVTANEGLQIVDTSDPALPETVGSIGVPGVGVALSAGYAYVRVPVSGNPGHTDLAVVDVRNPSAPVLRTQIYVADGDRVEVVGSYAYLTTGTSLAIYYVGNPASPQFRGSVSIPGGARELAVAGNTAYVGNLGAVYSVDVSNRSNPRIIGSVAAVATDLALAGTRLYALSGSQFSVIDVANPAAPRVLGVGAAYGAWGVAILGNSALLASPVPSQLGLYVVDVSVPAAPQVVADMPGVVGNADIAASGSIVAVNTNEGLQLVDVADPALPEAVGSLDVRGVGVALSGGYAYLRVPVAGNPGHTDLAVVDVRNPSAPVLRTQIYVADGDRVEVVGSHAYLTTGSALAIYSISNPTNPQYRGSVSIPNGARELAVAGSTAYVGNLSAVYSVDVSNPSSPRIVGSVSAVTTDLALAGTKLYALSGSQFKVIDVANPAAPRVLGVGGGFNGAWGIEAVGSDVFVASTQARELLVFDASNPAQPVVLTAHPVPGDIRALCKSAGFVYAGDWSATVDVLRVGP